MNLGRGRNLMVSSKSVDLIKDGAGLFCAVLEHFLKLQTERPKVLMATHYHGISTVSFSRRRNTSRWIHRGNTVSAILSYGSDFTRRPAEIRRNRLSIQVRSLSLFLIVDSVLVCHCLLMVQIVPPFQEFHKR